MRGREGVWKREGRWKGPAATMKRRGVCCWDDRGDSGLSMSGAGVVREAGSGGQVSARFRGQQRLLVRSHCDGEPGREEIRSDLYPKPEYYRRNLAFRSH